MASRPSPAPRGSPSRAPWWIPRIFGRAPELAPQQLSLLGTLGLDVARKRRSYWKSLWIRLRGPGEATPQERIDAPDQAGS